MWQRKHQTDNIEQACLSWNCCKSFWMTGRLKICFQKCEVQLKGKEIQEGAELLYSRSAANQLTFDDFK